MKIQRNYGHFRIVSVKMVDELEEINSGETWKIIPGAKS